MAICTDLFLKHSHISVHSRSATPIPHEYGEILHHDLVGKRQNESTPRHCSSWSQPLVVSLPPGVLLFARWWPCSLLPIKWPQISLCCSLQSWVHCCPVTPKCTAGWSHECKGCCFRKAFSKPSFPRKEGSQSLSQKRHAALFICFGFSWLGSSENWLIGS